MPPGGRAHVAQRSAAARCRGTRSTKVHDLYHYIIRILLHWFVYHAVHSIRKQFKGEILADACARSVRCTRPEFAWEVAQSCRRHRRPIAVAPALQLVCGGGRRPAAAAAAACMGRRRHGAAPPWAAPRPVVACASLQGRALQYVTQAHRPPAMVSTQGRMPLQAIWGLFQATRLNSATTTSPLTSGSSIAAAPRLRLELPPIGMAALSALTLPDNAQLVYAAAIEATHTSRDSGERVHTLLRALIDDEQCTAAAAAALTTPQAAGEPAGPPAPCPPARLRVPCLPPTPHPPPPPLPLLPLKSCTSPRLPPTPYVAAGELFFVDKNVHSEFKLNDGKVWEKESKNFLMGESSGLICTAFPTALTQSSQQCHFNPGALQSVGSRPLQSSLLRQSTATCR